MTTRRVFLSISAFLTLLILHNPAANAGPWRPISPEELKMTSVPEAPGVPAVILYRQVDRDDDSYRPTETHYVRIKILTDEGRKYGDVELPFSRDHGTIGGVKGRTIQPDGTVVNFDGKAFEKIAEKSKGTRILVKTFALPAVQVGSIIEYQYTHDFKEGFVYDSRWIVSDELFTKHAQFSLKPNGSFAMRLSWPAGLPAGSPLPKIESKVVRYEVQNVPAFQTEDYMPPENQLKMRVDFIYSTDSLENDEVKFWKKYGKKLNEQLESFVGKRKGLEQIVAEIAPAGDTPEVKLQKIYDRVQKLRNTAWEEQKTEQEQKREKQKEVKNSEQVWKQGYGDGRQINWTFIALARAAGFQAYSVFVPRRSDHFFYEKNMNEQDLNDDVVLVKVNGKDIYCDPATKFAPLGLLPWPETGVQGLQLDKEGGAWVTTSLPDIGTSRIQRKANFRLDPNTGSLEGKLTVTFSGLEALSRRIQERKSDDDVELRGILRMAPEAPPPPDQAGNAEGR